LKSSGVIAVVKRFLFADSVRPPAYRALALPFTAMFGASLPLLRGVALTGTLFAFAILVMALQRTTGWTNALFGGAMVFTTIPILSSGGWFGTEYPPFIATALLIASLAPTVSPVLLAAAVALGLLSKASFVVLAVPAIAVCFVLDRRDRRSLLSMALAGAAGVTVASGWWLWHLEAGLAFAQYGRSFERASLGSSASPAMIVEKLRILLFSFGPGVVLAVFLLIVVSRYRACVINARLFRLQAVGAAVLLPLIALAFASPVFVARHFCPAFLGLAAIVAVIALRASPTVRTTAALLVAAQAVVLALSPYLFFPRVEQTDWSQLQKFSTVASPRVAFMGGWPSMSPPEVAWAFRKSGQNVTVRWLWRFEEGPIDWERVMTEAVESDLVAVVRPGARHRADARLKIDSNIDNTHNLEFANRLTGVGQFAEVGIITVGRREPVAVRIYSRIPD
jgi:hypothetical protein